MQIFQIRTFAGFTPHPGALAIVVALAGFGFFAGIVFQLGIVAPYDKAVHGVFFFALAAAMLLAFPGRTLGVLALATGLAGASELVQAITPHHHASLADFYADMMGIWICVATAFLGRTIRDLRPQAA